MGDDISVSASLQPPDGDAPDVLAEGTWTCPCGGVTFTVRPASAPGMALRPTCPWCGVTAEIVPERVGDHHGKGE